MTTLREAAQQALEALESWSGMRSLWCVEDQKALDTLRAALERPEQEPVAWQERQARRMKDGVVTEWSGWYPCRYRTIDEAKAEVCDHIPYEWRPLYTHPPRREWQSLTDQEITDIFEAEPRYHYPPICATDREFARAIEAALKERNHG